MIVIKLLQSHQFCKHLFPISILSTVIKSCSTLSHINTLTQAAPITPTLYRRISPVGDPRVNITPIIDQWVEEKRKIGKKNIDQFELRNILVQLRKFRRFNHALQLREWIDKNTQFEVTTGDIAIKLDLISKVHGIQQAEEYFNNIAEELRDFKAYGALLNCYAYNKSLEKAEATMEKMRELGFTKTRLSYNVLINLYFQMGKRNKLNNLVREMKEKGIGYDNYTYSILLNVYATSSNLVALENLLMKMEADPFISMNWNLYVVATNGYIIAGQMDKALATIRKVELLTKVKTRTTKVSYEFLLTMYARIGHKDEVNRVWDMLKENKKIYNTTYLAMMSSLSILDDIEGMGKIFEDWVANKQNNDTRIPNFLVTTYCRKGFLEKAELLVKRLMDSCNKPNTSTWDRLATGYHRYGHMEKAVNAMKKALLVSDLGYKPNLDCLMGCLDYLEGKNDDELAEFRTLLEEHGHSDNVIRERIEKHIRGDQTLENDELVELRTPGSSVDDHDQTLENDELLQSYGFQNKIAN